MKFGKLLGSHPFDLGRRVDRLKRPELQMTPIKASVPVQRTIQIEGGADETPDA